MSVNFISVTLAPGAHATDVTSSTAQREKSLMRRGQFAVTKTSDVLSMAYAAARHGAACNHVRDARSDASGIIRKRDARWTHEHELDARVQHQVRAAVAADQDQPGAAVADREVDEIAAIGRDRRHGDMQEFAARLVQIFEPQLRRGFRRAQFEAEFSGASIDLGERVASLGQAEVEGAEHDEIERRRSLAEAESRPAENLVGRFTDPDVVRVERVAHAVDALVLAERDAFPHRKVRYGLARVGAIGGRRV